jgi:hypothetical protein
MKSILFWMLGLAVFAIGVGSAVEAQAVPKSVNNERFNKLDANGDKRLSEQEYIGSKSGEAKTKARKQFRRLDLDSDSKLSFK